MADEISHNGRILSITPRFTTVEILAQSACSACHASGLCGVSGQESKIIEVPTVPGNWTPGEEVDVCLRRSMGFKAVWLAYVIPVLVLMGVLLGLAAAGVKEWLAGLAALAATGVYYLILRLFKEKLSNEYAFYIKEKL